MSKIFTKSASSKVSTAHGPTMESYKAMLRTCLRDGKVQTTELEMLEAFREHHNFSAKDHEKALTEIGWSLENWEAAEHLGSHDEHGGHYGECKYPTKLFNPKHFPEVFRLFLFHTVAAPRLRQFYELNDEKRVVAFWRETEERKASWTELFFDLVFVALIYKLGHNAALYFPQFMLVYYSCWCLWMAVTNYATRYDPSHHEWAHPAMYFWVMFMTAGMSITVDEVYHSQLLGMQTFALCYVLALTPICIFYFWAAYEEYSNKNNIARRLPSYHALMMGILVLLVTIPFWITFFAGLSSWQMSAKSICICWGVALVVLDIGTLFCSYIQHKSAPICVDHWGERIALFVIIHCGESMFSITEEVTVLGLINHKYILAFIGAFFGLMIIFVQRRVYFDIELAEEKIKHALRRTRWYGYLWTFSHTFLCGGIVTFAIGVHELQHKIIEELDINYELYEALHNITDNDLIQNLTEAAHLELEHVHHDLDRMTWMFCGGCAVVGAVIALQSSLSKSVTGVYRIKYSQWVRFVIRMLWVLFCCVFPLAHTSAINSLVIVGFASAIWGTLESASVLKKSHASDHNIPMEDLMKHDYGLHNIKNNELHQKLVTTPPIVTTLSPSSSEVTLIPTPKASDL